VTRAAARGGLRARRDPAASCAHDRARARRRARRRLARAGARGDRPPTRHGGGSIRAWGHAPDGIHWELGTRQEGPPLRTLIGDHYVNVA